jgi:hypothetical protein
MTSPVGHAAPDTQSESAHGGTQLAAAITTRTLMTQPPRPLHQRHPKCHRRGPRRRPHSWLSRRGLTPLDAHSTDAAATYLPTPKWSAPRPCYNRYPSDPRRGHNDPHTQVKGASAVYNSIVVGRGPRYWRTPTVLRPRPILRPTPKGVAAAGHKQVEHPCSARPRPFYNRRPPNRRRGPAIIRHPWEPRPRLYCNRHPSQERRGARLRSTYEYKSKEVAFRGQRRAATHRSCAAAKDDATSRVHSPRFHSTADAQRTHGPRPVQRDHPCQQRRGSYRERQPYGNRPRPYHGERPNHAAAVIRIPTPILPTPRPNMSRTSEGRPPRPNKGKASPIGVPAAARQDPRLIAPYASRCGG